jgi:hypothetical protein
MTRLQFLWDGDGYCWRKSTTNILTGKIFFMKIQKHIDYYRVTDYISVGTDAYYL